MPKQVLQGAAVVGGICSVAPLLKTIRKTIRKTIKKNIRKNIKKNIKKI